MLAAGWGISERLTAGLAGPAALAVATTAPRPSLAADAAKPDTQRDVIRITWRDALASVDPYYNQLRTGLVLSQHGWDTLIYNDPDSFVLKPLLALRWKAQDDTTIDFDLRPGVTFHNGDPFTADDVVYTIQTVLADDKVALPSNFAYLAGATKLDELRVRVKLKRVFPAALAYIAMTLPIWPARYRTQVGAEAYGRAPIGTGPYRITGVDGMQRISLARNDSYFDGPKGHPAVPRIEIREVDDAGSEIDDLIAGRADWIWNYSPESYTAIDQAPSLRALRSESMRITYLSMDAAGRTDPTGPLTNPKVRQAIAYAIDRATMARQFMPGGSRVLDAPCYPTQFGCDASAAARYDYNPARARQLLTDAGYPDGFKTQLVSYTLPQWCAAVQANLKAVGIDAEVVQLQTGAATDMALAGKTPLYLGTWGSYSINDASAILPVFFGGGGNDYTRDPAVEAAIDKASSTTDTDQRRAAYSSAIKRITEQADWLPLFTNVTTYAMARTLNFKPSADEIPRFYLSSWR